jgi:hypothetical protein
MTREKHERKTRITVGVLFLLFIGLQRFIVAMGNKKT